MSDRTRLLEHINHELDALLEGQAAWADVPDHLRSMRSSLDEIQTDLKEIETILEISPKKTSG